jgi:hypothetical protein
MRAPAPAYLAIDTRHLSLFWTSRATLEFSGIRLHNAQARPDGDTT